MSEQVYVLHIYNQGWDCTCEAEAIVSGGFEALVCCRSLLKDQATAQLRGSGVYQTACQALDDAKGLAIKWAYENRKHL